MLRTARAGRRSRENPGQDRRAAVLHLGPVTICSAYSATAFPPKALKAWVCVYAYTEEGQKAMGDLFLKNSGTSHGESQVSALSEASVWTADCSITCMFGFWITTNRE